MRDYEGGMAECRPKNTYIATARTWIYFNMFSGKLWNYVEKLRNYVKSELMFVVVVIFFLYETFSLYLICITRRRRSSEMLRFAYAWMWFVFKIFLSDKTQTQSYIFKKIIIFFTYHSHINYAILIFFQKYMINSKFELFV